MELERNHSNFIRDLLVKVVLIVVFIFLLTKLFPMPNLTTFYDAVFNNNVQTMKEAAEDWFTTERMPKEIGDEESLSLQDMLDKKLILPFLDKDGKECDTEKSYVSVKKQEKEYTLKVYLSCNGKSDYIIEPIGCYNFCPEGKCSTPLVETKEDGQVIVKVPVGPNRKPTPTPSKPTPTPSKPTPTPSNPDPKPPVPTGPSDKFKYQYLYTRTLESGTWTIGEWQNKKEKESSTVKLFAKKTLYTGQKKVTKGTKSYKHVKYAYKDKWSTDTNWTDEVKTTGDNLRLYAKRTLYTGQKKIETKVTKYKHYKKTYTDNWKTGNWTTKKRQTSDKVVLVDTKKESSKTGSWSAWVNDSTWRSSKPANTSSKQWKGPYDTSSTTSWQLLYSSYRSFQSLPQYSGNRKYEFLYKTSEKCTTACNGKSTVDIWYYKVYQKKTTSKYRYQYRTYSSNTKTTTYYKYKENNPVEHIDVKWTDSVTPPAGYTYADASSTSVNIKYENIGKWVTSRSRLGEYTYNVATRVQYKYRYNNPEKYIADTIWTTSINSPSGYTYTGTYKTNTKTSYVDLGKWVSNKSKLGAYTYNIESRKQYKYKRYNSRTTTESRWFDSNPGGDWVYANQTRKIKIN